MLTLNDFYGSSTTNSGLVWSVVAADTTGANGNGYIFDNSSAIHTLTLPSSPAIGATIGFKDLNGYFASFPLTIDGVAEKINGFAEDMVVDTNNAYGELTYSGTSQGWILTNTAVGNPVVGKPMMHVQDQKAYNVDGGTSIADTWTARDLNTVIQNDIAGASLGTNSVNLPAGTYYVEGKSNLYGSASNGVLGIFVNSSKVVQGTSQLTSYKVRLDVSGVVTLSSSGVLDLRYYAGVAAATIGLGESNSSGSIADSSIPSTYSDLKIWKLDSDRVYNPKVFQPINQPVTGAYVTGGIWGGELNYVSTTQFSVNAFSCMADDNTTPLFINSTTTVTITSPVLNTIYNVFVIKTNTGTYGVLYDTDVNGANLGASVVAKRWLGFVRTNASANICPFSMRNDEIWFNRFVDMTINSAVAVPAGITTAISLTTFIPVGRVLEVLYAGQAATAAGQTINVSGISGTSHSFIEAFNTLTSSGQSYEFEGIYGATRFVPLIDGNVYWGLGGSTANGNGQLSIHAVKVRR